ncbi:MAG: hypothetical protein LUD15_10115 [Bacteroides sp.]|nr:hypothetical protein [Bacteroides sp.]
MKQRPVYEIFIEVLKEKIPEKGELTRRLMEVLHIEKEAVYRRLRGDVPFTFSEIVKLSERLEISLDNLIGTVRLQEAPFQLKLLDYNHFTEEDEKILEHYMYILAQAKDDPYSELGATTNDLLRPFYIGYETIYRFYLMKWSYQYGNSHYIKRYREIYPPDRLTRINETYLNRIKEIASTYFIWDELTFQYLVNDVKYFRDINLITEEEIKYLQKDLFRLLDDTERLAADGKYETGNKVAFYVSSINFEANFTYLSIQDCHLTMVKAFVLSDLASIEEQTYQRVKLFLQSLKRTSTLISESGEMQRILYFNKQREILSRI